MCTLNIISASYTVLYLLLSEIKNWLCRKRKKKVWIKYDKRVKKKGTRIDGAHSNGYKVWENKNQVTIVKQVVFSPMIWNFEIFLGDCFFLFLSSYIAYQILFLDYFAMTLLSLSAKNLFYWILPFMKQAEWKAGVESRESDTVSLLSQHKP